MTFEEFQKSSETKKVAQAGEGIFNASFLPTVDQSEIYTGKIANYSDTWGPTQIKEAQEEAAKISFVAPEKYGDMLMAFAVMGSLFTKENYDSIAKTLVGGSSIPENYSPLATGITFYFDNATKYDQRANTMAHYQLLPKARQNVKDMVDRNAEKEIEASLANCFTVLYDTACTSFVPDSAASRSSIKCLVDFVHACEEKNISLESLGATEKQISMVNTFIQKHKLMVRQAELQDELKDCADLLAQSTDPDEFHDPRLNDDVRDKYYEMVACESVLQNIRYEVEALADICRTFDAESGEKMLAERSATSTETALVNDFENTIKIAKDAVKKYSHDPLKQGQSNKYVADHLVSTAYAKIYEAAAPMSLTDYDDLFGGMYGEIEKKINAPADPNFMPEQRKAALEAVNELKQLRSTEYSKLSPDKQAEYRKALAKLNNNLTPMTDRLSNIEDGQTWDYVGAFVNFTTRFGLIIEQEQALHPDEYLVSPSQEELDEMYVPTKSQEPAEKTVNDNKEALLYGDLPENLKFGVKKGQRVTHIYSAKDSDNIEIDFSAENENNLSEVSQADAYRTMSDELTKQKFDDLVKKSASDYAKYGSVKQVKTICENVKAYVTASNRSGQQAALAKLQKSVESFLKDESKYANDPNAQDYIESIKGYKEILDSFTNGSLEIPKEAKTEKYNAKPEEPADANFGHIGKWTKFNSPIFPHEPSPNDIKQGKINDCFMMSSLIKLANDNPNKIRDNIRDNGDGTVTVRFYNCRNVDGRKYKEPVYVRVNKTVNKTLTGQHTYSSSSPWVQMVEKAYAVFMTDYYNSYNGNTSLQGFQRLDRGTSSMFMNAFDEDTYYSNAESEYGYSNTFYKNRYDYSKPKPTGYNDYEKELFNLISKTNKGEVMTVGSKVEGNPGLDKYLSSIGIHTKHAYAVLGTFEKDGKKYVQLQDPFASFRAGYDKNGKLVDNSALVSATMKAGVPNMGKFNLEFNDFLRTFNSFSGLTQETFKEYRDIRDKHKELAKAEEKAKVTEAKAEEGNVKGGFFDDGLEIVGNYEATEHKEEPKKEEKNLADEYDVIEKEEEKDIADEFDIVEMPQEKKDLCNYSKLEEARKNANDIINSGITNENKVEKSAAIENEIAKAIACFTVNEMVAKYGENMDQSQIDTMLSEETINNSAKEIKASEAFKRVMKEAGESIATQFFKEGSVEDFRPAYDKFADTVKQLAAEGAAPKKEQQIEKQQENIQAGPNI